MKITSDKIREVTKYSRIIAVEDGPVVDCGPAYAEGAKFKVETVITRWEKGEKPSETHVYGNRLRADGTPGKKTHHFIYWLDRGNTPDWLAEIVSLQQVDIVDPAAQIMNDIFANSPEFVEKMNAAKK